jgi:hypothetical protein
MAKRTPSPAFPETINIRGARPTSGNPQISRFLEPLIISTASKALLRGSFRRKKAEWDRFDSDFKIEGVEGLESEVIQPQDASWFFGTPVIDTLLMAYDAYIDDQGKSVPAGGIAMQNILLTVKQPKNIVRTKVPGNKGRIKQFISDDDFEIQAVGKIIAPPGLLNQRYQLNGENIVPQGEFKQGERPTAEIEALVRVLKAQIEVDVNSSFLNLFEIDRCVIGPYEFPQERGRLDNQLIRFTMWSDEDFDVTTGVTL